MTTVDKSACLSPDTPLRSRGDRPRPNQSSTTPALGPLPIPSTRAPTIGRPRPGRRRKQRWSHVHLQHYLCVVLALLWCCALASAEAFEDDGILLRSTLDRLARRGEIIVDTRPPPAVHGLARRQNSNNNPFDVSQSAGSPSSTAILPPASSSSPPTSTSSPSTTSAMSVTQTSGSAIPTASSNAPLPSAFDTSLGSNFTTSSCPNFFQAFLANSTFRSCVPISLLLQNSNSFFQAEKSIVTITQTLDASCNVNFKTCSAAMALYAEQIRSDDSCGQDFERQNPLVIQAYNGFVAYGTVYQAGCLRSPTGSYCFADAITNFTSPTDPYTYYVALGMSLPGGSRPTCNACLQNTMSIFANASSNTSQPVNANYVSTAQQIDLNCGPNFVNATIPAAKNSANGVKSLLSTHLGIGVAVMLALGHLSL